jgi:hypothetical protein
MIRCCDRTVSRDAVLNRLDVDSYSEGKSGRHP